MHCVLIELVVTDRKFVHKLTFLIGKYLDTILVLIKGSFKIRFLVY